MRSPFPSSSSRTRFEGGALLAVVALLCVLAVVQHRWLAAIAEGERRKLTDEANGKATAIAQDVDRELTRVFLELRVDGKVAAEKNGGQFFEQFKRWKIDSPHASLVKSVFVADRTDNGPSRLFRFDEPTRAFVEEVWPEALIKVKGSIDGESGAVPRVPGVLPGTPMVSDVPALVFPIVNIVVNQELTKSAKPGQNDQVRELFLRHAGRGPVEIILLDAAYLRDRVVSTLASSRLGPDTPFAWSVVNTSDGSAIAGAPNGLSPDADAKSPLLRVRFDDLDKSLLRGVLPGLSEIRAESSMRFVVQIGRPGAAVVHSGVSSPPIAGPASTAPWTLLLRHKNGSIDAAVRAQQWRNTALSASILGVLGISAGLVFFSARRLRAIATQQVEFVAAVSHELRTPLAVIRSAADNLADGVVDGKDQARRYGALIRGESIRLADMVEHVLEFAGADSPARASRGAIDAVEAARAAANGMEALVTERGANLTIDMPSEPLRVNGDMSHLTRAISNLLGNALKYGGDAPRVTLSVTKAANEIGISVADQGTGLSPSEIPHLFEPFFRGQRASEAQIPGSGLGLALVNRIVASHGGRVSAANASGGGAVFTIVLPAA